MNSPFYDEEIYGPKTMLFSRYDFEAKEYLKSLKGNSVMVYNNEKDEDYFTFYYTGKKEEGKNLGDIRFPFKWKNNKWVLEELILRNYYFMTSTKEDYRFLMDSCCINYHLQSNKQDYFNENYDFCGKANFVDMILKNPGNFKDVIMNSPYYNPELYPNNDFDTSMAILTNYFFGYKDSAALWINYPYPIQDRNIDKYVKSSNLKDYYIISFNGHNPKKVFNGCITIEFIMKNSKWYFNRVFKGTNIYIGLDINGYLGPFK